MSKITSREEFEKQDNFGVGAANDGFAQYFSGKSFLKPLTKFLLEKERKLHSNRATEIVNNDLMYSKAKRRHGEIPRRRFEYL